MYREVTMIEFREVLRLWQEQVPKKRIAAQLGLDPKTVRRYLRAAEAGGLGAEMETLSDEQVRDVLLTLQPSGGRPHGEDWTRCGEQREAIQHWLVEGLRLTKIRKLLARQGVSIGYPTLYRFAVEQLQLGRSQISGLLSSDCFGGFIPASLGMVALLPTTTLERVSGLVSSK